MMAMRARPAVRQRSGPFVLSARTLLLASGLLAVALGAFILLHEFHSGQVDRVYSIIALIVGGVWLACILLAFGGVRAAIFGAGAIAFVEFGVTSSSQFVSGAGALGTLVKHEGLPVATVAMALVPACAVVSKMAPVRMFLTFKRTWALPRPIF